MSAHEAWLQSPAAGADCHMMVAMRLRSFSLLSLAFLGCGDDPKVTPPDAAEDYTLGEHPQLAMACNDTLADIYTLPSGLPAMDDSHRGDVFRCAKAEKLMVPEIKTQIDAYNENKFNTTYENLSKGTIKSGFYSYRIAYRTTRATNPNGRPEGDTAAILLVPAKPIEGAPVVVFGHGSTGFAEKCAPSKIDLSAPVSGSGLSAGAVPARGLWLHRDRARLRGLRVRTATGLLQRRRRGARSARCDACSGQDPAKRTDEVRVRRSLARRSCGDLGAQLCEGLRNGR